MKVHKDPLVLNQEAASKPLSNAHSQPVPTPSQCPPHPAHLLFTHIAFLGTMGTGWALKGKNRPGGQF